MDDDELRRRYDEAAAKTQGLVDQLAEGASPPPLVVGPEPTEDPQFSSTMTRKEYEAGVERIREYIFAGDAFQVVLSQRLAMPMPPSPSSFTGCFVRSTRLHICISSSSMGFRSSEAPRGPCASRG